MSNRLCEGCIFARGLCFTVVNLSVNRGEPGEPTLLKELKVRKVLLMGFRNGGFSLEDFRENRPLHKKTQRNQSGKTLLTREAASMKRHPSHRY
eukprot:1173563-Amphidinium_carterae.1